MAILPGNSNLMVTASDNNSDTYSLDNELPLLKEYSWEFNSDRFILENGKFIIVEGIEALKIRVYKKLKTPKDRKNFMMIYSKNYGCSFDDDLLNKGFTEENKSKTIAVLRECIVDNKYIKDMSVPSISLIGSVLNLSIKINTVYGETTVEGVEIS